MTEVTKGSVLKALIDELGLQPGAAEIPKQVIDKIMPVVVVKKPHQDEILASAASTSNSTTIFTVPTDKSFFLTAGFLTLLQGTAGTAAIVIKRITITPLNKGAVELIRVSTNRDVEDNQSNNQSAFLGERGMQLEPGSPVTLTNNDGDANSLSAASIVGYTIELP